MQSSVANTVLQAISLYTLISLPSIWRRLAGDLAHALIFEPGFHTWPMVFEAGVCLPHDDDGSGDL